MARKSNPASASAGAAGLHKKFPSGSQSAAMLAAERANLVKARAQLAQSKGQATAVLASSNSSASLAGSTASTPQTSKQKRAIASAATRAQTANNLRPAGKGIKHALGTRLASVNLGRPAQLSKTARLTGLPRGGLISRKKPTGIFPRFKQQIAPTSFLERGSWKLARQHHKAHHLKLRKPRLKAHRGWRKRRRSWRPR